MERDFCCLLQSDRQINVLRTHPSSSSSSKSSIQLPNTDDADDDEESSESVRFDADEVAFDDSENGTRPPHVSAKGTAAELPSRAVNLGDACARAGCCGVFKC